MDVDAPALRLEIVEVVVVPVNHPKSESVVATLVTELDWRFAIETVSVPLVPFAMVLVVRLQEYCELVSHALLHAAKPGAANNDSASITAKIMKIFLFFMGIT